MLPIDLGLHGLLSSYLECSAISWCRSVCLCFALDRIDLRLIICASFIALLFYSLHSVDLAKGLMS